MSTTETKVRYTPGPWKVGFSDGSGETYIVAGNEESTVVVSGVADSWGIQQGVRNPADAVLIAAAPDMLEALEETLSWIVDSFTDEDDQPQGIVSRAQAAIAKAKGGAA